jgi:hypothetical protein
MTISTYADLLAALATFAVRSDQAANWPVAVSLGEARLNRLLAVRPMAATVTGTISGATSALPADFNGARALRLTGGSFAKLEPVSVDAMDALKARPDVAGEPGFYAVRGADLEVYPEPASATGYQLTYYQTLPALAEAAGGTNWLLAAHPDAYLYASLVPFGIMAQDSRLSAWEQALEAVVQEIRDRDLAAGAGDRLAVAPQVPTT